MDIMKDCFANAFVNQLRRMGYEAYENNESIAYIYKGEAPSREYICTFRNDFNLSFNKNSPKEIRDEVYYLSRLRDALAAPYKKYAEAEPFTLCDQGGVRKLAEYGNIVLAARLMPDNELHFITWAYTYNRTAVTVGHYHTTNFGAAQEDFAVRSGLISENNIFSQKETETIKDACIYRSNNDTDMDDKSLQFLNDVIDKIKDSLHEDERLPLSERIEKQRKRDDAR